MPDEDVTRRMGRLLRSGAALLHRSCPRCNTPLLRLPEGDLYCAKCDRRVTEAPRPPVRPREEGDKVLRELAGKILMSIKALCHALPENPHPEEVRAFAVVARDLVHTLKMLYDLERRGARRSSGRG